MTTTFVLDAEARRDVGKGASRRLRTTNRVPAILYGGHQDPQPLSVSANALARNLEQEAFYSSIIDLNVEGKGQKVVLKDLHRHPSKPAVLHLDLLRVSATEKLRMHVPLHFSGGDDSPGVKDGGGMESHNVIEVEVSCLAKDLPEFIEVDLSALELGQVIHLSELTLPEGVELVALGQGLEYDPQVAAIQHRKGLAEEDVEDEEGEEEGEGAVEE